MLTYFLTGYKVLSVPSAHVADFLELCRCRGFPYDRFASDEWGGLTLRVKKIPLINFSVYVPIVVCPSP